eukprot:912481-Amorphochlora_amoeboformis.AAC.1
MNGISTTSGKCQCSHLTEFALIAQQQLCQGDLQSPLAALYWIFIFPAAIFATLFALTILQTTKILFSKKKNDFILRSHLMMAAQSSARLTSCFLLSGLAPGFSVRSFHKVGILFVIVLPYSLTYLAYTFNAFQWISIIHNTTLSRNPFTRWWPVFVAVNMSIVVLAIMLFSLFLFGGYVEMVYVGSFALATLSLLVGVFVQLYGFKISKMMTQSAGGRPDQKRIAKAQQSACYMASPFLLGMELIALTLAFHLLEGYTASIVCLHVYV